MKRVYILTNGGHDYADAARFGHVHFCLEEPVNKWDTAQMFRELSKALGDAAPDDYVLVSALTSLCCVAVGILANRFGEVHLLLYRDGQYIERDIIFDQDMPRLEQELFPD